MANVTQLPDRTLYAGDYYQTFLVFTGFDYSAIPMKAELRRDRIVTSTKLGDWEIDDKTYAGGDTTIAMHLDVTTTRTIGQAGGAYWDLQLDFGPDDVGDEQIITAVLQHLSVVQDVTA